MKRGDAARPAEQLTECSGQLTEKEVAVVHRAPPLGRL